ncbi:MAG TPA: ABC transporter permease [Roseiflexaceae bacterium]|nr:ABC transporter permease [Roseiflexaceae bacterium]
MDFLNTLFQPLVQGITYLVRSPGAVWPLFVQHLALTGLALLISLLIAGPLSVLVARVERLRGPVLGVLGVIYTIPSLALFVLLIPFTGLGATSATIALVAYAQLVLVRNMVIGLTTIDPAIIEAARGMGMSGWQRFTRVELPLALPLTLAGTRLAALSIIAIGTVAAYINAGGLGRLLFDGVATGNRGKIVAGSLVVSLLAVLVNLILRYFERRATKAVTG